MRVGICLCTLAVMAPLSAHAQITRLNVQGPYTQPSSGMTWPENVGDFSRVSILQYKADGSDMSAGYHRMLAHAEIVATAYTFPIPAGAVRDASGHIGQSQCAPMAAEIMREVTQAAPSAKPLTAEAVTLDQQGPQQGFHGIFALTAPHFMDRTDEAVKSEAYVFCVKDKWIAEYRFSYPVATQDARKEIDAFMAGLKWTYAGP
jgi:hypothetical protein